MGVSFGKIRKKSAVYTKDIQKDMYLRAVLGVVS